MATKPTQSIFPLENGKMTTNLDANNLQIINLDTSNLNIPTNGGGGGGGGPLTVTIDPTQGATIYTDTEQTIPDNVVTYVTFDISASDVGGLYDPLSPTRLTAQAEGFYTITAEVWFDISSFAGRRIAGLVINHTTEIARSEAAVNQLGQQAVNLAANYYMNVGDYVEVFVAQSSGGDLNLRAGFAGVQSPFLAMVGGNLTGSGTGGGGNDTGTTVAILKGDGNHGFADAVADVDYASVASVTGFETSTDHDADLAIVTADIATLTADVATLTTAVGTKADSAATTSALALKTDLTVFNAYVSSNDAAVASLTTAVGTKADSATVTSALALKASITYVDNADALKEDLLPTSSNDGFVLVRDADETWRFVDPVTLGSTNASYGDGATHSNTTFNSTLAVFTTNDTGKTIVCSGNIPDDTTITFVNATTVTLSNAATTTASGLTFTILNRFLAAGTGGTVTSVAVTNNASNLLDTSVTNPTSSPVITLGLATTTPIHSFYGNRTGAIGTADFMTQAQALNNLGGTVVGQAIFQVTGISAISYPRMSADNTTCTMFTRPQVLADIGAETALTFDSPLVRGISGPTLNHVSIPAATNVVSGYLTSTDWGTFNAKVSTSTTLTTTAPLTIDGLSSANLSTGRTLAMPAAAGDLVGPPVVPLKDGYLTGADHNLFVQKPPNSRQIATTSPMMINPTTGGGVIVGGTGDLSANRTIAIQKATTLTDGYVAAADFSAFLAGSPHTDLVGNVTTWPVAAPTTRVVFTTTLTSALNITLPHPNTYPHTTTQGFIEFVDVATTPVMTNVGITLVPPVPTTIDGSASFTLPRGTQYLRINSNGGTRWTTTKYNTTAFQDTADPTKKALVALDHFPLLTPTRTFRPASGGDSASACAMTATAGQFLQGFNAQTGLFTAGPVYMSDLASRQDDITAAQISAKTHTVPDRSSDDPQGQIDTVRLSAALGVTNAPLTITWPSADKYASGEVMRFYDATGSITSTNNVIVTNAVDTFNGATFIVISEQYANRTFVADIATHSWAVSQFSGANNGTTIGFQQLTPNLTNHTLPWPCFPGVTTQTAYATITENTTLVPTGVQPGMHFELMVTQGSGGSKILTLPTQSAVEGNGLGVITPPLSTTAGTVDKLTGTYYGLVTLQYAWDAPKLNYTAATPLSCTTVIQSNGNGTTSGASIANSANAVYFATRWTPVGTSLCRVDVGLYNSTASALSGQTLQVELRADLTATTPLNPVGDVIASTNLVNADQINALLQLTNNLAGSVTNPTRFNFSSVQTLSTSLSYWIVVHASSFNSAVHPNWANQSVAPAHSWKSQTGALGSWIDNGSNAKLYFTSYGPT